MTRRKGEITARMNERDAPHIVELALPDRGFGHVLTEMEAFHRERGIGSLRGRRQRRSDQEFVRFCFADRDNAAAFRDRFGGTLIQPPSGERSRRPQRASEVLARWRAKFHESSGGKADEDKN
jgi:hypothetical protein